MQINANEGARILEDKPTLFLHVGLGKTGSSAIQLWLQKNFAELVSQGIVYPFDTEPGLFQGNGSALAELLYKPQTTAAGDFIEAVDKLLARYAELARLKNCHSVLLSSEILSMAQLENLQVFSQRADLYFKCRIIAVARDPYWWLWSAWGQKVKREGSTDDFMAFALENETWQAETLSRFIETFCDVRIVAYNHQNLIAHFARAIGIEELFYIDPAELKRVVNRSLSKLELDILLRVNRVFHDAELSRRISDHLITHLPDVEAYKHFDAELAGVIRGANAAFFAQLEPLIINSEVPIIDTSPPKVENQVRNDVACIDLELMEFILASIKSWHNEGSYFTRLVQVASQPAPEKNFIGKLPKGFNSIEYLLINRDVLSAGADPVDHYLLYGHRENRAYCRPESE